MTSVFLSYDRDDVAKARSIAFALEKAGHSVWWDRHIKSGAQYSREIDEALKRAEAVVVLWSERSVESAWVRDEAATGRDKGKLVPVLIGPVEPPLGFRQYQTTDLSRWKGRAKSAEFREMLAAIDGLAGGGAEPDRPPPPSPMIEPRKSPRPMRIVAGGIALVAIFLAGLLLWRPWGAKAEVPVVAVAAAGVSPAAQSLARDLLAKLGNLRSAETNSIRLVESDPDRNAHLTFEVDAAGNERSASANLVLLAGKDRALLWSSDFEQPAANLADLRQQLAYTAARVLKCAVDAMSSEGTRLRQETLKLHLNGCAGLSLGDADYPETLIPVLRRVVEEAPGFEGAWANLLRAEINVFQGQDLQDPNLARRLRADILAARRVNPTMAETFLAEAWLSPPRPINGWMRFVEKAVEANPEHSGALQERALGYHHVGRMKDALLDAQRAVVFDPLSPTARNAMASAYAFAGQFEAAEAELRTAERLWPGAISVVAARHRIDLRYGNARSALALLDSGKVGSMNIGEARAFLEARIDRSPEKVERALAEARAQFARDPGTLTIPSQSLAEFGRVDELVQILLTTDPASVAGVIMVLFRPQFGRLHGDPRFMAIAERLGLIDYWQETGVWPDFCARPDLPYDCKAEAAKVAAKARRQ